MTAMKLMVAIALVASVMIVGTQAKETSKHDQKVIDDISNGEVVTDEEWQKLATYIIIAVILFIAGFVYLLTLCCGCNCLCFGKTKPPKKAPTAKKIKGIYGGYIAGIVLGFPVAILIKSGFNKVLDAFVDAIMALVDIIGELLKPVVDSLSSLGDALKTFGLDEDLLESLTVAKNNLKGAASELGSTETLLKDSLSGYGTKMMLPGIFLILFGAVLLFSAFKRWNRVPTFGIGIGISFTAFISLLAGTLFFISLFTRTACDVIEVLGNNPQLAEDFRVDGSRVCGFTFDFSSMYSDMCQITVNAAQNCQEFYPTYSCGSSGWKGQFKSDLSSHCYDAVSTFITSISSVQSTQAGLEYDLSCNTFTKLMKDEASVCNDAYAGLHMIKSGIVLFGLSLAGLTIVMMFARKWTYPSSRLPTLDEPLLGHPESVESAAPPAYDSMSPSAPPPKHSGHGMYKPKEN